MKEKLTATEIKLRVDFIEKSGGILPHHEALYIDAISYSARLSASAFNKLARAVLDSCEGDMFISLQDALTHAAALSRYFWPGKNKGIHTLRAARLRLAFNVGDGSPLKDRDFRNALEHFDERLDEFLLSDPVGAIVPGPIVAPHRDSDDTIVSVFRQIDPIDSIAVIFGNKYEFAPVKDEVERILNLTQQVDTNGGRLPR
ncbi:MAG: hypothetical protein ACOH2J_02605 [Allorhizobium sp.]